MGLCKKFRNFNFFHCFWLAIDKNFMITSEISSSTYLASSVLWRRCFFSMLLSPASKSLKRLLMPVQDSCSIFLAAQVLVDSEMSSWVALYKTISSAVSVFFYSSCSSSKNLAIYTTHCVFPVLHAAGTCFLLRISRHIIMVHFLSGV
jgi:hypothetical protein